MTFHTFYPKTFKGDYYLAYDSESTWKEIVDAVLHDPVKPKMECPAIVFNRFKTVDTKYGPTIKNRYENLELTTGWYGLDVDNCANVLNLVRSSLIKIPELKLIWTSSSGAGVKAIGFNSKLTNLTPLSFKSKYHLLCVLHRIQSGMKINFDMAMARCHQPFFINSDPNAIAR